MGRHRRSARVRLLAIGLAIGLIAAWPAAVLAHPLGNFTINHYAEVRVEVDRILLDVVIDQAEIPTFQARQDYDIDGDGSVSDEEIDAGRVVACEALAGSLSLTVDEAALDVDLAEAGLSFPLGVGGLSTMRLVCAFEARFAVPIGPDAVRIAFMDGSFGERLGWREIVARGSGVTLRVVEGESREAGVSDRLRQYPEEGIGSPLSDEMIVIEARVGGPSLAAFDVPDAASVPGAAPTKPSTAPSTAPSGAPSASPSATSTPMPEPAAVPGGVGGGELPAIFREADLTPLVLLVSLVTAAALGAGHALTPGHGKTLMAAYLVGTRGSALHALGLGIAVSVSHTAGILALAAIIVAATDALPPDVVVRWAPVVAAASIVGIGGWMLVGELRRRRAGHASHDHGHSHRDGHHHGHDHAHAPPPGSTITWRSLFLLGLAGGLIPSTSALLILLGSIAAGRPAFGLVLVVAFGLGMATVMGGVGLALVAARDRFDRIDGGNALARIRDAVPLAAAVVVLGFGVMLTAQAISAAPAI